MDRDYLEEAGRASPPIPEAEEEAEEGTQSEDEEEAGEVAVDLPKAPPTPPIEPRPRPDLDAVRISGGKGKIGAKSRGGQAIRAQLAALSLGEKGPAEVEAVETGEKSGTEDSFQTAATS